MAVFAGAAVVDGSTAPRSSDEVWLAAILVLWAPAVITAVTAPVRWLDRQLRGEGAATTAISSDPELTHVEAAMIRLALAGALAAASALVVAAARPSTSDAARGWGMAILLLGLVWTGRSLWTWAGRAAPSRVVTG